MTDRPEYYQDWWEKEETHNPYNGKEYWHCGGCNQRRNKYPCIDCSKKKRVSNSNPPIQLCLDNDLYGILIKLFPSPNDFSNFISNLLIWYKENKVELKVYPMNKPPFYFRWANIDDIKISRIYRKIPKYPDKSKKFNYLIWRYLKMKDLLSEELKDKFL